jgi:hypothetical protein
VVWIHDHFVVRLAVEKTDATQTNVATRAFHSEFAFEARQQNRARIKLRLRERRESFIARRRKDSKQTLIQMVKARVLRATIRNNS